MKQTIVPVVILKTQLQTNKDPITNKHESEWIDKIYGYMWLILR